jgi:hypothetical protein
MTIWLLAEPALHATGTHCAGRRLMVKHDRRGGQCCFQGRLRPADGMLTMDLVHKAGAGVSVIHHSTGGTNPDPKPRD